MREYYSFPERGLVAGTVTINVSSEPKDKSCMKVRQYELGSRRTGATVKHTLSGKAATVQRLETPNAT